MPPGAAGAPKPPAGAGAYAVGVPDAYAPGSEGGLYAGAGAGGGGAAAAAPYCAPGAPPPYAPAVLYWFCEK